jgi:hypothetical protein
MKKPTWILGSLVIVLLWAGAACRLTTPTPAWQSGTATAQNATDIAAELTQISALDQETITTVVPTLTQTPLSNTATSQPPETLKAPWLVYPAPDGTGIHAYNVDTEVILEVTLPEPVYVRDLLTGLSPDGQLLVIRAGSPLNTDELALYQIALPSTEITRLSPLLSLSLQREIVNEGDPRAFETFQAVTLEQGLAWSPDGRYLAFTAALNNNSSDIYIYDTETERVERLNGLYSHSVTPFWSPANDRLFTQQMRDDGDETGWRSEIVSTLRVTGFGTYSNLYSPGPDSQMEIILGWANAQSFVSYSQTADGPTSLRQVNYVTHSTGFLWGGAFTAGVMDPGSRTIALVLMNTKDSELEVVNGVYLLRPEGASLALQRAGEWDSVTWDPGGLFIASGLQGMFGFTPDGDSVYLPAESQARVSPNGSWLIGWGDGTRFPAGARLYQRTSGNRLQDLTQLQVEGVFWAPDSRGFFMFAEGVLYHVEFPGLKLVAVNEGWGDTGMIEMIWIE